MLYVLLYVVELFSLLAWALEAIFNSCFGVFGRAFSASFAFGESWERGKAKTKGKVEQKTRENAEAGLWGPR